MAPKKRKGKAGGRRAGAQRPDDVITADRREKRRLKKLAKKKRKSKRGRKCRLRDLKNIPAIGGATVDGHLDASVTCCYGDDDGTAAKVKDVLSMPNYVTNDDQPLDDALDINPANVKRSAYVIDVTCGDNEAILFMKGLSTGSKGACVLFEQNWLTPNEFQYVSGRESAKDWKRSIKHHGKSLKILVSRGLMCLKQRRCKCYTCEGRVKDDDDVTPENADRQLSGLSGSWSRCAESGKSTSSRYHDTTDSADVIDSKFSPNEGVSSTKSYIHGTDLCTTANGVHDDPDHSTQVPEHRNTEEHLAYEYSYHVTSGIRTTSTESQDALDPDTYSNDVHSAAEQSDTAPEARQSRVQSSREIVPPLTISRSFDVDACDVPMTSSLSDSSKTRKRGRPHKEQKKVMERSNELDDEEIQEKYMKLDYRDSSVTSSDSSDVSSESNDVVKGDEKAQSAITSCDSDVSPCEELHQSRSATPERVKQEEDFSNPESSDRENTTHSDVIPSGSKSEDDRAGSGDDRPSCVLNPECNDSIQNDNNCELASLLEQQQQQQLDDKPKAVESGCVQGSTADIQMLGERGHYSDSSNPERSRPPADRPGDSLPVGSPDDSDSTSYKPPAPEKRNSVKKACRLLSIIDGLKSAPKDNKPVSPTSTSTAATTATSTENSQTVHKSRKDTVPKQYTYTAKAYNAKESSAGGIDAVHTGSTKPAAVTSNVNHVSSQSRHGKDVLKTSHGSGGATVGSPNIPKQLDSLMFRPPLPIPMLRPFPVVPFGMSIPPTLYASMTQNGVPLEWQLALMNSQLGPNELVLLTSAMVHQSSLIQNKATANKGELSSAGKTSATGGQGSSRSASWSSSSSGKQKHVTSHGNGSKSSNRHGRHGNNSSSSNNNNNNNRQDAVRGAGRAAIHSGSIHPAFGGIGQLPAHGSYREALSQRALASVQKSGADAKSGSTLSWADLRGGSADFMSTGSGSLQPHGAAAADVLDLTKRYAQHQSSGSTGGRVLENSPDTSCQPLDLSVRK